jgi:hypothetical protein
MEFTAFKIPSAIGTRGSCLQVKSDTGIYEFLPCEGDTPQHL